jgi:hypothetical protein
MMSVVVLALAGTVRATIYSYDVAGVGAVIPDGNPVGITSSTNISLGTLPADGTTASIVNVDVRLHTTGGFNGDLYGYLVLQSADSSTTTAVLLNRVGTTGSNPFGAAGSGFNVTLSGNSVVDIHTNAEAAGLLVSGTYAADGRLVDPAAVTDTSSRTAGLGVLNGKNANGVWTLYLADMVAGDQSTLASWGVDISVVPEPVTWAVSGFGLVLAMAAIWRRRQQRA